MLHTYVGICDVADTAADGGGSASVCCVDELLKRRNSDGMMIVGLVKAYALRFTEQPSRSRLPLLIGQNLMVIPLKILQFSKGDREK